MGIGDNYSDRLGMECLHIEDDNSSFRMEITDEMLNIHNTCHGGMIFTLADTAFAFACNSSGRKSVAQGANIDYIAPAFQGDVLTASATARVQKNKTGIYDVEVRNQSNVLIAILIGKAFTVGHG
jgi:acyl-CoA thioesterase